MKFESLRNFIGIFLLSAVTTVFGRADPELRLLGTVWEGTIKLAAFSNSDGESRGWVAPGQRVGNYSLTSVGDGEVTLTAEDGKTRILYVEGRVENKTGAEDAPFTRKWINSKKNPMLHNPMSFSEISRSWPSMTKEERDAVFDFYLKHGWKMVRIEMVGQGALSIEWENIYTEERGQMVRKNRQRFAEGLSSDQKALWDELSSNNKVVRIDQGLTDAHRKHLAKMEALSKRFRSMLSPTQEQERATIPDFTKGDW